LARTTSQKSAKFQRKASVRKSKPKSPKATTVIIGADISMSSIALAGIAFDATLKKRVGPGFHIWRWDQGTHYFDRITDCVHCENFIWDVYAELKLGNVNSENVYIAVEEPWPFGIVGKAQSGYLKQQAEISGAFLAGLLKYGFRNIFQISANSWRKIVADGLGISTHHTRWKDQQQGWNVEDPCGFFNCKPDDLGKFRAKAWALSIYDGVIPDWPEIIEATGKGKVPRPKDSRAKAVQCDDRYDALAVCAWMEREWRTGLDRSENR
jgi:hypothetical protein